MSESETPGGGAAERIRALLADAAAADVPLFRATGVPQPPTHVRLVREPPPCTPGRPLLPTPEQIAATPVALEPGDVALRDLEYLVVDVETTGGSTKTGHRITEVAALRVAHDGTVLEEFATLVNPERPIPPFITALTNISWDMVRNAPRFHEIAPRIERLLTGRIFVAHNAAFDWRFLSWELERATGMTPAATVLCTVRLARKMVPELSSRSLDALCYYFGLDNEARHRAYGDARVTAALLGRLLARAEEGEVASWSALEELLGRRKKRKPRRRKTMPASMDPSEVPAQ